MFIKNSLKLILLLFFVITGITSLASEREQQIRQFVENELKRYPKARLQDLYKNYFQDAFGPGHLIPDTAAAGAYLDWELRQSGLKSDERMIARSLAEGTTMLHHSKQYQKAYHPHYRIIHRSVLTGWMDTYFGSAGRPVTR